MSCHLKILLSPRAGKNVLAGFLGDELKIKIVAPPVDGAANAVLIKYLSKLLGCRQKQIKLIAGQTGRHKIVKIEGLAESELWERLNAHLP